MAVCRRIEPIAEWLNVYSARLYILVLYKFGKKRIISERLNKCLQDPRW